MEAGLGSSVRQNRTHLTSTTSVCHPLRIHVIVPLDEASFRRARAVVARLLLGTEDDTVVMATCIAQLILFCIQVVVYKPAAVAEAQRHLLHRLL